MSPRILPPEDSDEMNAAAASPQGVMATMPVMGPRGKGVNDWMAHSREDTERTHETPSLLHFAMMEERRQSPEYQRELSDLLTRKFREYFP